MRARLLVTLALAALALTAGPAAAEELSPAAQSLAQCVQNNQRLSVLMLIDESGSLRTTDPSNERVDGIKAALTGLADLAETPVNGTKPEVSVLMAGFYARAHPDPSSGGAGSGAWKAVDRETVDVLNTTAGDYARLNHGRATDYGTALIAARQLLKERLVEQSAEGGQPPCEALIWFTDGRYSLPRRVGKAGLGLPKTVPYAPGIELDQPGAGKRAVSAGKEMMCKPGGLMDELADSGVVRFTVALSTQLAPADGQFLSAATTGSAGSQRCGARLSPRTGQYLDARNSDSLFFAFGGLLSATPPIHANPVCPGLACVRGQTRFSTVPGLSQFLIRAASGVEGAELELSAPGGRSVRLAPEGQEHVSLAGTAVTARWVSPTAVEVQGEFQPGGREWVGNWSYAFVDPQAATGRPPSAQSHSSVQLFTDLEPSIAGDPSLIRGVPTKLAFQLDDPALEGQGLSSGPLLRSASLTASIDDPVAETSTRVAVTGPDESGKFTALVTVPERSSASFVYLSLTAHLAIPGGTPVAPQYRSYQVPVRFPPGQGFPLVSPSSLAPGAAEGTDGTEAELTVTGSSVAGGCVWLGDPDLRAPDAVTMVTEPKASSADGCLHVGKGEQRTLTVRFLPRSGETGDVSGSLPLHLSSEIVPGERRISVPVSFAVSSPPDAARRDALLVVLVLFGALFPLLFLHLLNYLTARFTAPQDLLVLAQGAEAGPGGVSAPVTPEYTAFEPLTLEGENRKVRALTIDQLRFRTVATSGPTGLFRGPFGIASAASGGPFAAGSLSRRLRSWRGGARHEVPLSLAGCWFFVPEPAPAEAEVSVGGSGLWDEPLRATESVDGSGRIKGRLILVIANGGDTEMGEKLLADADRALRSDELREGLVARPEEAEAEEEARVEEGVGVAADPVPPPGAESIADDDDDPWA